MTWICHVCGAQRPDALISVYSRTVELAPHIYVKENVRHCNDRPSCVEGAKDVHWIEPKEAT